MEDIVIRRGDHFLGIGDIPGGLRGLGIGVRYIFKGMRGIISVSGGLYVRNEWEIFIVAREILLYAGENIL